MIDFVGQHANFFIQLSGWIGAFFSIVSYQFLYPRHTLMCRIPCGIFMGIHYWGLGAFIAAIIVTASAGRDAAGAFASPAVLKLVSVFYMLGVWGVVIFYGNSYDDVFLAVGTSFMTFAAYLRDSFWKYRFFLLSHNASWFIALLVIQSYPGLLVMSLSLMSNLSGIIRHIIKTRKDD